MTRPDAPAAIRGFARELALDMSPAQVDALVAYLKLLLRWNKTYNLTAVRDPSDMLSQHLADCLAVVPSLLRWVEVHPARRRVLDVGSGGGLPGVVLAIMLPTLEVTCIDTVGKKAAFVQQVALELRLRNLRAVHARVESLGGAAFDLVTCRAFSSLADFTRLTSAALAPGGEWVAMKGKRPDEEIAALPVDIDVFHVEHIHAPGLDAERCLVWMRAKDGRASASP